MPDSEENVETAMMRVMRLREEPSVGRVGWLWKTFKIGREGGAPPGFVRDAFERVFETVRHALDARDGDFALGNASLRRSHEGLELSYRWREDSVESARCSCAGMSVELERRPPVLGSGHDYRVSKRMSAERGDTSISASDDRRNGQISEADCEAIERLFERASEGIAPSAEGDATGDATSNANGSTDGGAGGGA